MSLNAIAKNNTDNNHQAFLAVSLLSTPIRNPPIFPIDFDNETNIYISSNIILRISYSINYYNISPINWTYESESPFSFILLSAFIYPAVIMPAGSATIAIPKTEEIIVIILPAIVTGYISPYPTVVKDTVAQ